MHTHLHMHTIVQTIHTYTQWQRQTDQCTHKSMHSQQANKSISTVHKNIFIISHYTIRYKHMHNYKHAPITKTLKILWISLSCNARYRVAMVYVQFS